MSHHATLLRIVALLAASASCTAALAATPASSPPAAGPAGNGAQPVVLDRIVAVVNQGVILQSELANAIALTQSQLKIRGIQVPPVRDLQGQVLEHMIMTRIQLQRAKADGIRVDDGEITAAIARIAEQNHTTPTQFMDKLASQGVSSVELRNQVRDEITMGKLRQKEVDDRINVTSQDIDLFLANHPVDSNDQYQLSNILVAVPENATPAQRDKAKAKADQILDELHKGANFAQLAVRDSDGQNALQGGKLGWRKADDLPTFFAHVVPGLKVGGVSEVISAANGYNIIRLDDERSGEKQETVEENDVQQILLTTNPLRDEAQTQALAQKLYAQIKGGADFGKLAEADSDDTQSKNDGGKMGWQPPGALVPSFQQQVDALQPGQLSQPFQTRLGWHIVKLLGRRTVNVTDQMRRARARAAIMQQREAENYETWLQRLRAESYVDNRLKPGMITDAVVAAAANSA
ncbi:MAG TPA: peptidylprolyl isomerase [Nevskiaceae bacterium]